MKTKKYLIRVSFVLIILLISFLVSCESGDEYCATCEDIRDDRPDKKICAESEEALGLEIYYNMMWGGWSCERE